MSAVPEIVRVDTRTPLVVERRFAGPPGMGNGGYVAGRVAGSGPARVVLRRPVPLERTLQLDEHADHHVLRDAQVLLVEASPAAAPDPVELSTPPEVIRNLPPVASLEDHPFPGCFVCGPLNETGLRLMFKPTTSGVGAVFTPPTDEHDVVPVEYIVGALDCTSGWSSYVAGEAGVLGTIEYAVTDVAERGETLVAVGESAGRNGRKRHARSSVFTSDGRLIGSAEATWVDIVHPNGSGDTKDPHDENGEPR